MGGEAAAKRSGQDATLRVVDDAIKGMTMIAATSATKVTRMPSRPIGVVTDVRHLRKSCLHLRKGNTAYQVCENASKDARRLLARTKSHGQGATNAPCAKTLGRAELQTIIRWSRGNGESAGKKGHHNEQ